MTELSRGCLKFIEHGSEEYEQAAQLRYRLFYQSHNIPYDFRHFLVALLRRQSESD